VTLAKRRARNGQGTITPRKLADGTVVYDAKVSVKDPITGVSSRPSKKGIPSHDEAVEWIETQRASKTRNVRGMTVDDLAALFWGSGSIKDTTLSHWQADYDRNIRPYLGSMALSDLLPMHIDAWVLKVRAAKKRKASTLVAHALSPLSAILKYGALNKYLDTDWTKVSPAAKKLREDANNEVTEDKQIWTVEQFHSFLELETEPSFRALWIFMAATGVRRGTACGLSWSEVDFDKKVILAFKNRTPTPDGDIVSTQKGGKRIKIWLDEPLEAVLLAQKERQDKAKAEGPWEDHDVVFDRPLLTTSYGGQVFIPGRPMRPQSVTERFSRLAREAGNPPASPHDLRHMWVTLARSLGVSRDTAGDIIGHRSKAVTRVYDHYEGEKVQAVSGVSKLLLG